METLFLHNKISLIAGFKMSRLNCIRHNELWTTVYDGLQLLIIDVVKL